MSKGRLNQRNLLFSLQSFSCFQFSSVSTETLIFFLITNVAFIKNKKFFKLLKQSNHVNRRRMKNQFRYVSSKTVSFLRFENDEYLPSQYLFAISQFIMSADRNFFPFFFRFSADQGKRFSAKFNTVEREACSSSCRLHNFLMYFDT